MKKTCILHIGTHKTGTTSIQNTFFRNKDKIKQKYNINYLDISSNHSKIGYLYSDFIQKNRIVEKDIPTIKNINVSKDNIAKLKHDFFSSLKKNQSKYFIISGENLSLLEPQEKQNLIQDLSKYFTQIRVIVYVRDPYSFATSQTQQFLKRGLTFEKIKKCTLILKEKGMCRNPVRGSILPNYKFKIKRYLDILGKENLIIRQYDRKKLYKQDVVADFTNTLFGIKNFEFETINKNVSLDHTFALCLETLNNLIPMYDEKNNININRHIESVINTGDHKFKLLDFDYKKFSAIIYNDVLWLKSITNGAIDFDTNYIPLKSNKHSDYINFDHLALHLNTIHGIAKDAKIQASIYKTLWSLAKEKTINKEQLTSTIFKCNQVRLLFLLAKELLKLNYLAETKTTLSRIYYLIENHQSTIKNIENVKKQLANTWCFLGQKEEDPTLAKYSYQKAIQITPKSMELFLSLCNIYKAQQDWQTAIEYSNQMIDINENHFPIYPQRVQLFTKLKQLEKAEEAYQKGVSLNPNNPHLQALGGNVAFEQKNMEQAQARYLKVIALNHPKPAHVLFRLGIIHQQKGNVAKAVEYVEKACVSAPKNKNFKNKLKQLLSD